MESVRNLDEGPKPGTVGRYHDFRGHLFDRVDRVVNYRLVELAGQVEASYYRVDAIDPRDSLRVLKRVYYAGMGAARDNHQALVFYIDYESLVVRYERVVY